MFDVLTMAATRLAPLAPHAAPVLRIAGREAAKMVCINLAARATMDTIVHAALHASGRPVPAPGQVRYNRRNQPVYRVPRPGTYTAPPTQVRTKVWDAVVEIKDATVHFTKETLRIVAKAVQYVLNNTVDIIRESGPTIALLAIGVGLVPYYPNAAVGCYLGAMALIGLRFARAFAYAPTYAPVSFSEEEVAAETARQEGGATAMPTEPPVVVTEPTEFEIGQFETLDPREAKRNSFQYGVAVAHRHLAGHPERRDDCERALREALIAADIHDGVQVKVMQGFAREAMKLANRTRPAAS